MSHWASWQNRPIVRTFMTDTYTNQKKQMDESEVNKLEQAIDVHGYRGQSKMKHNGVVNIKPDDNELWKSLKKYNQLENHNIDQIIDKNNLSHYCDVKVVAHCPNGNRSIGSLYTNDKGEFHLILLGFTNYNYQLF